MDTVKTLTQVGSNPDDSPQGPAVLYLPLLADSKGVPFVNITAIVPGGGSVQISGVDLASDDDFIASGIATGAAGLGFNGSTWDRVRSSNVFKSVAATAAGLTAVWTPAAGNKFRLLAWRLSVAGTLAADGTQVIQLRDGAVRVIARAGANVAAALPANDTQIGEDYGSQGQLSTDADNVLNISLGTAMATGAVFIDVWGVEETPP